MVIRSLQNPKVKQYAKLMQQKKERERSGRFIVEGEHLVFEALAHGLVEEILVLEGKHYLLDRPVVEVSREVMNRICDTKTPQGIIACCQIKQVKKEYGTRVLLLDDIQDPGNLGTLIRSADAFGFDTVIRSPMTVDLYNPKVVRATQGAIFRVNTWEQPLDEAVHILMEDGFAIYRADLDGQPLATLRAKDKMAFVLGNEAHGVSEEMKARISASVTIEMASHSESLNVGVAGSIIMYQFRK